MVLDFSNQRAIIFMDVTWIEAKHLEKIENDKYGYKMGAVLVRYDWRDLYVVNIRKEWNDQQYFDFAESLINDGHL